jgi:hypothetical protein
MSTDRREERLARRISHLYATDQQFADAQSSNSIRHAIESPQLRLPEIVATGLTQNPVRPDDRAAVLGVTSIDYATADMALLRLGAVAVPLQTSAPLAALRPSPPRPSRWSSRRALSSSMTPSSSCSPAIFRSGWWCSTTAARWTTTVTPWPPRPRDPPEPRSSSRHWLAYSSTGSSKRAFPIRRVTGDYAAWLQRFETTVRALPERQRQASLLPLLHNYQRPETPILGSIAPTDRFRSAVRTRNRRRQGYSARQARGHRQVPHRPVAARVAEARSARAPSQSARSLHIDWPPLAAPKWPIVSSELDLPWESRRFASSVEP